MPNRWNTSIMVRIATGFAVGVGSCALLAPVLRNVGIRVVATITSVRVPAERLDDLVTRVWDTNAYVLWLAWVCAAVAVAVELAPDRKSLGVIAFHVAGEELILLAAVLMLVHAQLVVGVGLVQALAGLLVFSTLSLPVLAVWRNGRPDPTRVFDAQNP